MIPKRPAIDWFRITASLLVCAIHTSPLISFTADGDFWLTRVLARVAVPFFFLTTGYFLAQSGWTNAPRFLKKTGLLSLLSILLYLPLNIYAHQIGSIPDVLRALCFDGTFYHLWYFPAVLLGVLICLLLLRGGRRFAFAAAALLYLIGLGGDSYYGLFASFPAGRAFYNALFHVFSYTRNGLFFAPLFLLLGGLAKKRSAGFSFALFLFSLCGMSAEVFLLRANGLPRHDSMTLLLPVCAFFLFTFLLSVNAGQDRMARRFSAAFFVVHPWCIVLVRGLAKGTGTSSLFVENSLGHFAAVVVLTSVASFTWAALRPDKPRQDDRAWREIDTSALRANARLLAKLAGPKCRLMAVLKADGYGHGSVLCARVLHHAGVRDIAVATLTEGIRLRRAGVRGTILILGYTAPEEAELLVRYRLTQAVVDEDYAMRLASQGWHVHVHVAVDTGMRRIGVKVSDMEAFHRLYRLPCLRFTGLFSHLCAANLADSRSESFTDGQIAAFLGLASRLRREGYPVGQIHLLASAGLLRIAPLPCDLARPGLALFGVWETQEERKSALPLRPVLSLHARVASVRTLNPGEHAGYGLAFEAVRPTVIATISIGYGDGLPRRLGENGGAVLIHGTRAPIAGRICMDQLLADVTDIGTVRSGEIVTLIGRDGAETITAEEVAGRCGTITNELLAGLSGRLGLMVRKEKAGP